MLVSSGDGELSLLNDGETNFIFIEDGVGKIKNGLFDESPILTIITILFAGSTDQACQIFVLNVEEVGMSIFTYI